jgi:Zn-dependent peptidase ImmA (M78 family)
MNGLLPPAKVSELKEKANMVLAKYSSIDDPRQLLFQIAKDEKIKIVESDLFEMSGALRKENNSWIIYVNSSDSEKRRLFTIAHELGHFFAHSDTCSEFVDGQLITRTEQEKYAAIELEANEFAGNLIMPEMKVRELIADQQLTEQRVIELAKHFNVSALAMATRLRNLDYDVPGYKPRAA